MIEYGLISDTDARTLEKTIDLVCDNFKEVVNICEVGVYSGMTARGMVIYTINEKKRFTWCTGIDNRKDNEEIRFDYDKLIIGNSNEVYNQLENNSQHLILIDANHSYPSVISDYYCYKGKVKRGGYLCFHDTSPQAQGKDWQRMGDEKDPDMSISVRKALNELGLLNDKFNISSYREYETISRFSWELVFDEFDPNDEAGGICVFKKLY
jgi:hypothetical protein